MRLEQQNYRLQQAEYMALFTESDPDPVYRIDINGKILQTNHPGMLLLANSDPTNQNIQDLIKDISFKEVEELITSGSSREYIISRDDRFIKFIFRGIPKLKAGHLYGSDITELKEKEQALITAVKKAEDSERLKDHFLSQMSHEIRSPLNSILGFNRIIQEELHDQIPEELKPIFHSIDSSGKRLYRTIDLNLNMAMVLTDNFKIKQQKLNLVDLLQPMLIEFRHYAREKSLGIYFENKCENPVAEIDQYAFNTIIQNLIDNAIKYTKSGEIRITAMNTPGKIHVIVKDSGIGISEEFMKRIFDVFSQEITGYSRPYDGNGLGLALSKKLALLSNGDITVKSQKGSGSEFTVTFSSI